MANDSRGDASIRLFFDQFRKSLVKIRDDLPTANPVQRAHIMLGQLHQFEKMVQEFHRSSDHGSEAVSLSVLRRISDFRSFLEWIVDEQSIAPILGLYYRTRQRDWECFKGSKQLPPDEPFEWLIKGALARRDDEGLIHYFVFAYSELRLVITFAADDLGAVENAQDLCWFVAKVMPVYLGGPMHSTTSRLRVKGGLVAKDPHFLSVLGLVERAAKTDVSIMLEGESGTGKELIANFIHERSPRQKQPLVAVNCAAIPSGLIESELFGHEKGAFTGAYARQAGRIEEANGGTLFLDEIGEMELPMQSKLLRFLQLHEFHRVGGKQKISVDVRIVAATNRNLKQQVAENQFREDLYYRLSVMPFRVPPLRERAFDIAPLTRFFIEKYTASFGLPMPELDPMVVQLLAAYDYPGNVRELENLVQNMLVTSQGKTITASHLPDAIRGLEPTGERVFESPLKRQRFKLTSLAARRFQLPIVSREPSAEPSLAVWRQQTPETNAELKDMKSMIQDYASELTLDLERRFLDRLLDRADGSMPVASKMAGINRTLLYKMIERTKETS